MNKKAAIVAFSIYTLMVAFLGMLVADTATLACINGKDNIFCSIRPSSQHLSIAIALERRDAASRQTMYDELREQLSERDQAAYDAGKHEAYEEMNELLDARSLAFLNTGGNPNLPPIQNSEDIWQYLSYIESQIKNQAEVMMVQQLNEALMDKVVFPYSYVLYRSTNLQEFLTRLREDFRYAYLSGADKYSNSLMDCTTRHFLEKEYCEDYAFRHFMDSLQSYTCGVAIPLHGTNQHLRVCTVIFP